MSIKSIIASCLLVVGCVRALVAADAYVEAGGGQYVPVNYYANAATRIEADFQFTDASALSQAAIFGSWGTKGDKPGSGTCVGFWSNAAGNPECTLNGKWTGRIFSGTTTERYQLTADLGNFSFTLTTPTETYQKTVESTDLTRDVLPIGLFAGTPADFQEAPYCSKARIYSFKIYEGAALVRDLVPCRKGGRAGFYDQVSKEFYTDCGDGGLTTGGDGVLILEDDPYVVASDGGVSVMTGYQPTPKTCIELDYALLENTKDQFLFESGSTSSSDLLFRLYVNGQNGTSWSCDDTKNFTKIGNDGTDRDIHVGQRCRATLDSNNGKIVFVWGNVTNANWSMETTRTVNSVRQLRLFSNADGTGNFVKMKVYGLKISEDGVLKHDYRPMSSGGAGILKDAITGRAIASDTATPLATGGAVSEEPYVESIGNQVVVLDYKPNEKSHVELEFSHLVATNKTRLAYAQGALDFGQNANGNQEFFMRGVYSGSTGGKTDGKRHTAVWDMPSGTVALYTGGSATEKVLTAKTGYISGALEASQPLTLFGYWTGAYSEVSNCAARIYSVMVTEDGVIKHQYMPYVKDGIVGFRDEKTGSFFGPSNVVNTTVGTKSALALLSGGAIAHDEAASDAYIESDESQYIDTKYLPGPATRIELDAQMMKTAKDQWMLGSYVNPRWGLYINGNIKLAGLATVSGTTSTVGPLADFGRHIYVLDRPRTKMLVVSGAVTNETSLAATSEDKSTIPLGLFSRRNKSDYFGNAKMRVFSFRIWEAGDLKMELLPYKSGDEVGLKDTVSGNVYTSDVGNPFVIGGKGYDGTKTFETALAGEASVAAGGSVTFGPVFAPGAIRYEWTRGGVPLAETGDTVTLGWERVKGDHMQEIAVTPIYSAYGTEVKGEPSTAMLTNKPLGLVIVIE